jgi:hypothetical protein
MRALLFQLAGDALRLSRPLREQARSHSGFSVITPFVGSLDQMWERACSRRRRYRQ